MRNRTNCQNNINVYLGPYFTKIVVIIDDLQLIPNIDSKFLKMATEKEAELWVFFKTSGQ